MRITPSAVGELAVHHSILSCLLRPDTGGIIDDTVITRLGHDSFHLVTNAACRDKDVQYISSQISILNVRQNHIKWKILEKQGLVALQGPLSAEILQECIVDPTLDLHRLYFGNCAEISLRLLSGEPSPPVLAARAGYTGEDGFELSIPAEATREVTSALLHGGGNGRLRLAGLGARDSLRLEAGLCLYGHELDDETTPVEAGLAWIISPKRRERGGFHGSEKILRQLNQPRGGSEIQKRRIGLIVNGSPARAGAVLKDREDGTVVGRVTSGGPSPSLGKNIAMGYVRPHLRKIGTPLMVEVRGKLQEAQVVKLPFLPAKYWKQ